MLIFHEGMPRQGKSYASMKDHIIPALKRGRKVYARLNGADDPDCRAKVADLCGFSKEELDERYIPLSEEDCLKLWLYKFDKDALIVLDEPQNFWPQQRAQLNPELIKFITEHGHHGWDILLMGQLLKDVHRMWVNRVNRKIQFQKKDALGKPNDYKWTMFQGKPGNDGNVKFTEVMKGDDTYEEQYFGTYKSHSDGTENFEAYDDSRVVIWNHPMFKKWLPIFGVVLLCALGYLVYFFRGGMAPSARPVKVTETVTTSGPNQPETSVTRVITGESQKVKDSKKSGQLADNDDESDYIAKLSKEHKIRLGLVMHTSKGVRVVVEWRDDSNRVIESLQAPELEALGWRVLTSTSDRLAIIARPGQKFVATAWPIDEMQGKATNTQIEEIRSNVPAPITVGQAPFVEQPLPETAPIHMADAKPLNSRHALR